MQSSDGKATGPKAIEGEFQPVMDAENRMVHQRYREAGDLEWKTVSVPFHAVLEWASMISQEQAAVEKRLAMAVMELRAAKATGGRIIKP